MSLTNITSPMAAHNTTVNALALPISMLRQNSTFCAPMLTPKARIFNMLKNSPFPEKKKKKEQTDGEKELNQSKEDKENKTITVSYSKEHEDCVRAQTCPIDVLFSPRETLQHEKTTAQMQKNEQGNCF